MPERSSSLAKILFGLSLVPLDTEQEQRDAQYNVTDTGEPRRRTRQEESDRIPLYGATVVTL